MSHVDEISKGCLFIEKLFIRHLPHFIASGLFARAQQARLGGAQGLASLRDVVACEQRCHFSPKPKPQIATISREKSYLMNLDTKIAWQVKMLSVINILAYKGRRS